ncbi:hypothetical protein [Streptomyces sp. NPDC018045]|uniref:hypothetical protein n=1 Tax=Streptomyces sp. NPDC018045 TaxID=3365037 RepID=UPI003798D840
MSATVDLPEGVGFAGLERPKSHVDTAGEEKAAATANNALVEGAACRMLGKPRPSVSSGE